jgi:hypothetical protein
MGLMGMGVGGNWREYFVGGMDGDGRMLINRAFKWAMNDSIYYVRKGGGLANNDGMIWRRSLADSLLLFSSPSDSLSIAIHIHKYLCLFPTCAEQPVCRPMLFP